MEQLLVGTDRPPVKQIYVIGSLKNPRIPEIGSELRSYGYRVFDDWWAASEDADDWWQGYEKQRGRTFAEALAGAHAQDVFDFDKRHIDESDIVLLVLPAGKSGHLELGYGIGLGKPGFILLDKEPDRFDVMYNFATAVVSTVPELVMAIERKQS